MRGLELLRKVAEGSAVEAFIAKSGEGHVLVQVSRPELLADMELYGRFLDSTRQSTNRSHPALVSAAVTHCHSDGRFYVVSQPVLGRTAADWLAERGALESQRAVVWGATLCEALSFLHGCGVTHGNLSPPNVFLDGDPADPLPRLLDTGLLLFRADRSLPTPGVLVAPEYLSPERVSGKRATPASDVYGIGVLLFELLTGEPPFRGPSPEETRARHLLSPMPALPEALADWAPLLERCLAKDPAARFRSVDEVRVALLELTRTPPPSVAAVRRGSERPISPAPRARGEGQGEGLGRDKQGERSRTTDHSTLFEAHEVLELELSAEVDADEPLAAASTAPPVVLGTAVAQDETRSVPPPPAIAPVSPPAADVRVGTVLGSYVVEKLLGEGGMGRVFLASHAVLGRKVALKVMRMELVSRPDQVRRFVQEAQAVNHVRHPNIVEVSDLVQEPASDGGRVYFVMELLDGRSVRDAARETPFALKRALAVVRQAAEALAAAHAVGVVHRDIKPDNLFLTRTPDGRELVKVLDFGVARMGLGLPGFSRATMVGQVVGTPLWMAPEQLLGREVDARADVYGLGMVLYVLLARKFPFEGTTMDEVVLDRLANDAAFLGPTTTLGEAVPQGLRDLVAECLARDLKKRPASMTVVAQRLAALEALPDAPLIAPPSPVQRATPARGASRAEPVVPIAELVRRPADAKAARAELAAHFTAMVSDSDGSKVRKAPRRVWPWLLAGALLTAASAAATWAYLFH